MSLRPWRATEGFVFESMPAYCYGEVRAVVLQQLEGEEGGGRGHAGFNSGHSCYELGPCFIHSTSLSSPLPVPLFQTKTFPSASWIQTGVCPLNQPTTLEGSHEKLKLQEHVKYLGWGSLVKMSFRL